MPRNYLKAFNVEISEQANVLLLLVQSVFIGVFFGSISTSAEALFTGSFEDSMISPALFLSSVSGILLTIIYSRLQAKIAFWKLGIINLIAITVFTFLLRFGFGFFPEKWLIFALFILFGPFNIIAQVQFWGSATRMFNLRQGKRLFGLIDTGWAIGVLATCISIPVILSFDFSVKNILFISFFSILGAVLVQIPISRKLRGMQTVEANEEIVVEKKQISYGKLLKNKYTFSIILFVTLSVMVMFFIYNSFLSVSQEKYAEESSRTSFFSLLLGTVMVFSILLKTFAYDNLMKTYGMKIGILLAPIVIGIISIITAVLGSFGYTSEASVFIFFFLLITLSRLLSFALNISIEKPASKLMYQSLDESVRHDVQAKIDGTINEVAVLFATGLLSVLGLLSYLKIIHFSYLLIVVIAAWLYSGFSLYKQYKNALENALSSGESKNKKEKSRQSKLEEKLSKDGAWGDDNKLETILFKQMNPLAYESMLPAFLNQHDEQSQKYVLDEIEELKLLSSKEILAELNGSLKNEKLKSQKDHLLSYFQEITNKYNGVKNVEKIVKSVDVGERLAFARYIAQSKNTKLTNSLSVLLRDAVPSIRKAALIATVKTGDTANYSYLFEALEDKKYFIYAYHLLLQAGEDVVESLEQLYNKTGASVDVQLRVLKLYGEIKGEKVIGYLLDKLASSNIQLVSQAALSLRQVGFVASEDNMHHVQQAIQQMIAIIAWNLSVIFSLTSEQQMEELETNMRLELADNYETLFNLLSVAYDPASVDEVRNKINSGTVEGVGFGLELLDLFVAEELKQSLILVLEDTSIGEKVKSLQNFFPVDKLPLEECLISIMNRDINQINSFAKALAIKLFPQTGLAEVPNDIIAHLFNPDILLSQTAALTIKLMDSNKLDMVLPRLSDERKKELAYLPDSFSMEYPILLIDKVLFLNKNPYFSPLPQKAIYELARRTLVFKGSEKWVNENKEFGLLITANNNAGITHLNGEVENIPVGEFSTTEDISKVELEESAIVYLISGKYFSELLFDFPEFLDVCLQEKKSIK